MLAETTKLGEATLAEIADIATAVPCLLWIPQLSFRLAVPLKLLVGNDSIRITFPDCHEDCLSIQLGCLRTGTGLEMA